MVLIHNAVLQHFHGLFSWIKMYFRTDHQPNFVWETGILCIIWSFHTSIWKNFYTNWGRTHKNCKTLYMLKPEHHSISYMIYMPCKVNYAYLQKLHICSKNVRSCWHKEKHRRVMRAVYYRWKFSNEYTLINVAATFTNEWQARSQVISVVLHTTASTALETKLHILQEYFPEMK